MYLSRFCLNENNETRRFIASPQKIHATVENCVRDKDGNLPERGTGSRNLWRLDELGGKQYILILSPTVPDFSPFLTFGSEGETGETLDYEPFLSRLKAGQRWQFRLRGNAVHSKSVGIGKRGKVYAHTSIQHKLEWLIKKSEQCGFKLIEKHYEYRGSTYVKKYYDVVESNHERFKRGGSEKDSVALGIALYEGELEITDEELFRKALTQGIGRAKAYGCGLLTLASHS